MFQYILIVFVARKYIRTSRCHNGKKSLNVLTYPLILSNIKTNGLVSSPKYLLKYLECSLFQVILR